MSEPESNTEREQVWAAIDAVLPTEPAPLPAPEPQEDAAADDVEAPVVARPASSRALPAPPGWMRHRHEAAGLVTAFVAIVWLSTAFAAGSWGAALLGLAFAFGAAAIRAYAPVETT